MDIWESQFSLNDNIKLYPVRKFCFIRNMSPIVSGDHAFHNETLIKISTWPSVKQP